MRRAGIGGFSRFVVGLWTDGWMCAGWFEAGVYSIVAVLYVRYHWSLCQCEYQQNQEARAGKDRATKRKRGHSAIDWSRGISAVHCYTRVVQQCIS